MTSALQARYEARRAQDISATDKKGWIYVLVGKEVFVKAGRTNNPERRLKEHRRRCKMDETELSEAYKLEVCWVNRVESLLHLKLKLAGFRVSALECACGVSHIERYECSPETVDGAVDKIKQLIEEVKDE